MTAIGSHTPRGPRHLMEWPVTRAGRWGAGLVAAALVLWFPVHWIAKATLGHPVGGGFGVWAAIAGGVLAIYAIVRGGERSLVVLAALLPWLSAALFLVFELIGSH